MQHTEYFCGQFINGRRTTGTGAITEIRNPANQEVITSGKSATVEDVADAVAAAKSAYAGWATTTPSQRSDAMARWAEHIRSRAAEFADAETAQAGKPTRLTNEFDVPGTIDNVAYFSGAARHLEGKASGEYSAEHTSSLRREPIGVIGSIAPWNYPLQMAAWKILPAVAAGNTIVLKPAEITPLTSIMFAEAATEAGIPDGVINIVTGPGATVGNALTTHEDISMVSFTGSTSVGHRIAAAAAGKRLHLELGGKAPFVVFDDADLSAAANGAVAAALINSGQDCTAATRAYIQRPLYDDFVTAVADLMTTVRLGDPRDGATDQGPLVSRAQQQHVAGFVERARDAGAKVVCGGKIPAGPLERGHYYEPTLVTGAAQRSEIVQDEIFGPVLVVLPFDSDDDGITLANDTPFGLAASVWSRDVYRTQRASREIAAGCVWVNDHIPITSEMPHGGYKKSGYGKDMSMYSLEEYTNIKHVMSDITGSSRKDWHRTVFG